ncbi:MUT7 Exonuclease, partial [Urocolius indicus]|nr:MUT7 Exonuclease [Urocolius indicus]
SLAQFSPCPAWGCVFQVGRRCPEHSATISPASYSLFFQVCNCNKYLKVSRERMRQLAEGSVGDSSAGCLGSEEKPSQSCIARATAQPSSTAQGEWPEGPEQRGAAAGLAGGTVLQVSAVPPGVLDKADLTDFYCCTHCGKVFWEGSHFGRVVSQFQDVLVAAGDEKSVYELS